MVYIQGSDLRSSSSGQSGSGGGGRRGGGHGGGERGSFNRSHSFGRGRSRARGRGRGYYQSRGRGFNRDRNAWVEVERETYKSKKVSFESEEDGNGSHESEKDEKNGGDIFVGSRRHAVRFGTAESPGNGSNHGNANVRSKERLDNEIAKISRDPRLALANSRFRGSLDKDKKEGDASMDANRKDGPASHSRHIWNWINDSSHYAQKLNIMDSSNMPRNHDPESSDDERNRLRARNARSQSCTPSRNRSHQSPRFDAEEHKSHRDQSHWKFGSWKRCDISEQEVNKESLRSGSASNRFKRAASVGRDLSGKYVEECEASSRKVFIMNEKFVAQQPDDLPQYSSPPFSNISRNPFGIPRPGTPDKIVKKHEYSNATSGGSRFPQVAMPKTAASSNNNIKHALVVQESEKASVSVKSGMETVAKVTHSESELKLKDTMTHLSTAYAYSNNNHKGNTPFHIVNDVEIVVVDRDQTEFAEKIDKCIKEMGLLCDLMFYSKSRQTILPLDAMMDKLGDSGTLFCVVILPDNEIYNSVTIRVMDPSRGRKDDELHFNMPMERAWGFIQERYEKIRKNCVGCVPSEINKTLQQLVNNELLKSEDYVKVINFLQKRRQVQMKFDHEYESNPLPLPPHQPIEIPVNAKYLVDKSVNTEIGQSEWGELQKQIMNVIADAELERIDAETQTQTDVPKSTKVEQPLLPLPTKGIQFPPEAVLNSMQNPTIKAALNTLQQSVTFQRFMRSATGNLNDAAQIGFNINRSKY